MLETWFTTAASSRPSPFRSATAIPLGWLPHAKSIFAPNVPVPVPSSNESVPAVALFPVTRSSLPSPLKSPTATPVGEGPVA